jgi:hypothetical protein
MKGGINCRSNFWVLFSILVVAMGPSFFTINQQFVGNKGFWRLRLVWVAGWWGTNRQADQLKTDLLLKAKMFFLQCVVVGNRLYTTTTNGLRAQLFRLFSVCFCLQTACAISYNQNGKLLICY